MLAAPYPSPLSLSFSNFSLFPQHRVLKLEDKLRDHPFYTACARLAIEVGKLLVMVCTITVMICCVDTATLDLRLSPRQSVCKVSQTEWTDGTRR